MPGGRVQPVVFVKHANPQKLDSAKNTQLEDARRKSIVAQQAMRDEQERVSAEQQLSAKSKMDEEKLRVAHEAKLAEGSAPTDMKSQQDADEELKRWQLAGLAVETRSLDNKGHGKIIGAIDALRGDKMPTTTDTVSVSPAHAPKPDAAISDLTASKMQPALDNSINSDAELAAIRDRINRILNSDLAELDIA